jgi:hypothetical protein
MEGPSPSTTDTRIFMTTESPLLRDYSIQPARAPGYAQELRDVGLRSVLLFEHFEDALVLFDVPTILIVVFGDRHGTDASRFLLP